MNYRKFLIRLFTFLGGIYFFLRFVLPERIGGSAVPGSPGEWSGGFEFGKYHQQISDGFVLIGSMAVGLGLVNLLMVHGSRLVFKRKGWVASLSLLGGLFLMLSFAAQDWAANEKIAEDVKKISLLRDFSDVIVADHEAGREGVLPWHERNARLAAALSGTLAATREEISYSSSKDMDAALQAVDNSRLELPVTSASEPGNFAANKKLSQTLSLLAQTYRTWRTEQYDTRTAKKIYSLLVDGLFTSLGAAMFSLLGFYIAAAAYRAFRIKSAESALMMTAAVVVMLGQIPFGVWLWGEFPALRLWLLQIPNAAASRAIEIGAAVAGLVMAFRMWLSIESEKYD